MNEFVFPCSPNWYLTSVSSGSEAGLYAFGAKNHVYVYDVSGLNQQNGQMQFLGDGPVVDSLQTLVKFITTYTDHEQKVTSVCLCPDSEQLICCSADESCVRLWDIQSLTTIQFHNEHREKITCMTWSPCNTDLVLTASEKGTVVLWRLKSNSVTSFQPQRVHISCMQASPHSAAVVAIGYQSCVVIIMNVIVPQILQKLRGINADITSIAWCPLEVYKLPDYNAEGDSGTLIAAAGGRLIKLWNSVSGQEVFYKKLSRPPGQKYKFQDGTGKKLWLDIVWPKSDPGCIVSNSLGPQGELCLWNLQDRTQQEPELFNCKNINKHTRVIFNIRVAGDKICSFSLDRIIAVWDLKSRKGLVSWWSYGGYPYCIKASPVDPGMVAIGSGDNSIRVWNMNSKSKPFSLTCFSYGARTIITALAWHPEKEGLLAYGTEDGQVGIVNTLTVKPPVISYSFHKKTVYVVTWGPPVQASSDNHHYHVYSVGDGKILQHFIKESGSKTEAVNLTQALSAVNDSRDDIKGQSDIFWKQDYTAVAIGHENGAVHVYNFPGLRLILTINIHFKIINTLRWHPEITAESPHGSPCRNWLAFAGNDRNISVVELPSLLFAPGESTFTPVTIKEAICQLPGHPPKTTDLCWSPHQDGRLVSVGYDKTAIVWNVKTGEGLVSYTGHKARLMTVLWSHLDPDLIITGAYDFTTRVWRVSAQTNEAVDIKERRKKKKVRSSFTRNQGEITENEIQELQDLLIAKKKQLLSQIKSDAPEESVTESSALHVSEHDRRSAGDGQHFRELVTQESGYRSRLDKPGIPLESTCAETSSASHGPSTFIAAGLLPTHTAPSKSIAPSFNNCPRFPSSTQNDKPSCVSEKHSKYIEHVVEAGSESDHSEHADHKFPSVKDLVPPVNLLFPKPGFENNTRPAQPSSASNPAGSADSKKKRTLKQKVKSFFPVSSLANNQGKASLHEDILDLTRIVTGSGQNCVDISETKPHLGLFTDRLGAHRCLLTESATHLKNDNMEYHLQMELWRGNVAGAIQIARQRNELSDWIVAMAPLASHDLWELVSEEYAEQLEEDGKYHKAATYLLAANKVHQAIELFRRHKLYKEAVSLARMRLSPVDPLLDELYTEWGQTFLKDGQYELAAKCYLAMRQIQEAGKAVTRRQDQSSLKTACHMTLLANEKQHGLSYAYKLFSQYLAMGDWQEAHKFISEHESLKVLLPILGTHELLVQHLSILLPSVALTQKPVTSDMFSQWEKKESHKVKAELPEFLLDKLDIDPVVPWEPFLVGKHTFPHHVLRVWHQHLDVTMVTQELKALHAVISQLVPQRQTVLDLAGLLVLVSVDVTLCLLALLTSETSSAISHLLQAMSSLYQANYLSVQQALCRLMLPQGPKYLLKLQQEFNASRVLITLESHGDMDKAGCETHNSIKRFLTDIKDDTAISMSNVRCRELDCLRAYCYLAILDFLRETCSNPQVEDDSLDGMPNGKLTTPIENCTISNNSQTGTSVEDKGMKDGRPNECDSGLVHNNLRLGSSEVDNTAAKGDVQSCSSSQNVVGLDGNVADLDQNGKLTYVDNHLLLDNTKAGNGYASHASSNPKHKDSDKELDDSVDRSVVTESGFQESVSLSTEYKLSVPLFSTSNQSVPKHSYVSYESSVDLPLVNSPVVESPVPSPLSSFKKSTNGNTPIIDKSSSHKSLPPSLKTSVDAPESAPGVDKLTKIYEPAEKQSSSSSKTVASGYLNYTNLLRLSKGILWDVQAKKEALTNTLGYVHQAISQHLLLHRSDNVNGHFDSTSDDSNLPATKDPSNGFHQTVSNDLDEDGGCFQRRLPPEAEKALDYCSKLTDNICEEASIAPTFKSTDQDQARSVSPQPKAHTQEEVHRSFGRSLSETCFTSKTPLSTPSKLDLSVAFQVEQELLTPVKNESVTFQKSRKVLWMDDQETSADEDPFNHKSTFRITRLAPDGSPIPLEWDDLPVDSKYTMPYVSLALLKQEQKMISKELKKVPDVSGISFPATADSVKKLLETSIRSSHLSKTDRSSYIKQLGDWATVFAVTSYQRSEMEALFASVHLE